MARPMLVAFSEQIRKEGGDRVILDRILAGTSVSAIADDYRVSKGLLYAWRNLSPQRRDAWEAAMEESGDAHVDTAQEIMDGAPAVLPGEAKDKANRADFYLRLAAIRNRQKYGKDNSTNVNLNMSVGSLHLDALRKQNVLASAEPQALGGDTDPPTVEAEILSDEPPTLEFDPIKASDPEWKDAIDELL